MQVNLEDVAGWLRETTTFEVSVAGDGGGTLRATVGGECPVTLDVDGANLAVECTRELSPQLQKVMDLTQLKAAARAQSRTGAFPAFSAVSANEAGSQSVGFRVLLHLDGLTRNEAIGAVWQVWKAQEILEHQIAAFRELEAISSELEAASPEESAAAGETPPRPSAARFCQRCGKQARPEQRFCTACGAALQG